MSILLSEVPAYFWLRYVSFREGTIRFFALLKIMVRKRLIRSPLYPYHITARSNNQQWFYIPSDELWKITCNVLFTTSVACGLRVHAFVLMSNHFHLLASTPDENIDQAMNYFMREVSRSVNFSAGRVNHVFGGRYKWTVIQNSSHYFNTYRYICQNPLRAGISRNVLEFPFTTLRGIFGLDRLLLPLWPSIFDREIEYFSPEILSWLGQVIDPQSIASLKAALRRKEFEIPVDRSTRRVHELPVEDFMTQI